jgi:tetratricopeptide (TPR) repeat protein
MPDGWDTTGDDGLDPRERALRHFEMEIREAREQGDARREARAHAGLGSIFADQGRLERAADEFRACLFSAREGGDREGVAWSLFHLGRVHGHSGSLRDGLHFLRESHVEWNALDHSAGLIQAEMLSAQFEAELGRRSEALELLNSALGRASTADDPEAECRALRAMAEMHAQQGRWRACAQSHKRSIPLLRDLGNPREEAHAWWGLVSALFEAGEVDEARQAAASARGLFRTCEDKHSEASVCAALATALAEAGESTEGLEVAQEALRLLEETGDRVGLARTYAWIAEQLEDLGRWVGARDHAERAVRLAGELGLEEQQCRYLKLLAGINENLGDADAAERGYRRAVEVAQAGSHMREAAECRALLGGTLLGCGRTEEGLDECQRALHDLRLQPNRRLLARTLYASGNACYRLERFDDASRYHREQLTVAESVGDAMGQDRALEALAQIAADRGQLAEARGLVTRRLALSRESGNRRAELASLWSLADIARRDEAGEELLHWATELEARAEAYGQATVVLEAREAKAGALLILRRLPEAAAELVRWIPEARASSGSNVEPWTMTLAVTYEQMGDEAAAAALWEELLPALRSNDDTELLVRALRSLLARAEDGGDRPLTRALAEELVAAASRLGDREGQYDGARALARSSRWLREPWRAMGYALRARRLRPRRS